MKITIDGPAGSGKSTIAKLISKKLKIPYLETGSVYRALAFILKDIGLSIDGKSAIDVLKKEPFDVIMEIGNMKIIYEGKDIAHLLGDEEVGRWASLIAEYPPFKEAMNEYFRKLVKGQAVIEGRDAGLYIFPYAEVKFFLTASPEERAMRRWKQIRETGKEADYVEILRRINERDERDANREKYPFKPAEDAIIVDTTGKRVEEVFTEVFKAIISRCIKRV